MKTCPACQSTYPDDFSLCPRDGAHLTAQATETEAQLAAGLSRRFRLVRRLGQGGMGTVFLAEQIGVGNRPVALKVLNRKLLDDPDFLLRFQNEAASTGRIHHPNVVTIHESAQSDDGTPYIAMEFLEGESLHEVLKRRGALPVAEVAEILQQAARGLNAAHKLGIIHRDLKPDNIFLTYPDDVAAPLAGAHGAVAFAHDVGAGLVPALPVGIADTGRAQDPPLRPVVVKVVDFGIAKLRESGAHTQTGMVLGTPAYMSFEQASGMRSDELDARSDVYSLGVVVYEMLTGRTPFHSDTPVGYLRMHMQEDPPPFRAVKPDLPALPQLESVVMKALTKNRDQRYGSVLEFAREFAQAAAADSPPAAQAELQREIAKHQPQATVAPVPKTSVPASVRDTVAMKPVLDKPYPSRRKWFVVAGSLVFLTVAATGVFWYWTKFGWRPAQGQVESPSASSAPSGLRPGGVETPISAPPPLDLDMSSAKPVLAPSPPTQSEQQEWRDWLESNAHVSRPAVGSIPCYSDKEIRDLKEGERVKAIKKISLCDWTKLGGEHLEIRKRPGFGIHTSYIVETLDGRRGYVRADYVSLDNGVHCNELGCSKSQVRENPKDGLKYVWIPPGTFMMGCSPGDTGCGDDEKPPHQVTITKGFWMGQTEVTVGAYKRFAGGTGKAMPETPSFNPGWNNEQMPVVNVSWNDAQAYCAWAGGRLPTEAEWEYAARAGSTEGRYGFLERVAWYSSNSGRRVHPVGEKQPNAYGLYDMLGNAEEWVNDWYDEKYYQRSPSQDPAGPTSGTLRVLRGWSCLSSPKDVRVSSRSGPTPAYKYNPNGFRCGGEVAVQIVATSPSPKAANVQSPKPASQPPDTKAQLAEKHFLKGYALFSNNDFDGAIAETREAMRLKPDFADAHGVLGLALEQKGDLDGAIAEYREAIRLRPDFAETHYDLGLTLGKKGDLDGAIAEYREAIRLKPDYAEAHNFLGVALGEKGDLDGEIAEHREAIRLRPGYAGAHWGLGMALGQKGDFDGAVAEYREVVRLRPNDAQAHFGLGVNLGLKGDWDGEITEEKEAIRLKPDSAYVHNSLGVALEHKGQLQAALREYQTASDLDPKDQRFRDNYDRLRKQLNPQP